MFAVRSPRLEFPYFACIPANLWDHLASQFSGKVEIRDRYRVIRTDGVDELLLSLLDGNTTLEAGEGFLLMYRKNKLIEPEYVQEMLTSGLRIYSLLCGDPVDAG